ncbi:MAG: FtsX-like permease family protein [Pseudomonadota bacterium]
MRLIALTAILAHWRRKPGQLVTLLLGLALATALWSAVQAINAEARASYDRASGTLGGSGFETITDPAGPIPIDTFIALRRAGWLVSPVLEGRILVGDTRVLITGLELLTAPPGAFPVSPIGGEDFNALDLITPPGLGFASPQTVARLAGSREIPRLRNNALIPDGQIITDIGTAERLLDREGEITRLTLLPDQPRRIPPLSEIAPQLRVNAAEESGDVGRLTDSFHLNLTAFGLLSFVVGLFIVHGAIGLAFEQRRSTFRTLRALGLPVRDLMLMLLAELLIIALFAGAAGILIGYLIAGALLPDVASTLRGLYGARVPGTLSFDPVWALYGLAIAVVGALFAAGQGLWQIRTMPLLASAQSRAWATASSTSLRLQSLSAIVLIVLGLLMPVLLEGLIAGFAMLAGMLIGSALLLPVLLSAVLSVGAKFASGIQSQWFWADTRQQLPGLSLALMALLLALAANIGVSTMVGSFRLTFTGWLDQRLASELYVSVGDAAESERFQAWIEGKADAVLPTITVEAQIEGAPGEIDGVIDQETYRASWPLLTAQQNVWDRVAAGETALINEQLSRREDLQPGDTVNVGADWQLEVGGVYSDYGNPRGQAIVSLALLEQRFPDEPRLNFAIRSDNAAALASAMRDDFGLDPANIIDQASIKEFSLNVFERTFTITGALNVLTLSVAGFAILTALLTLASLRLPQLAPAWALGITRQRLSRLELLRSVALAALTFVLAVPVGLALAWALLAIVNVEAFGWQLPMHIFPMQWLWLFVLAVVAAALAAFIPARRLAATAPADFLKVFSNER